MARAANPIGPLTTKEATNPPRGHISSRGEISLNNLLMTFIAFPRTPRITPPPKTGFRLSQGYTGTALDAIDPHPSCSCLTLVYIVSMYFGVKYRRFFLCARAPHPALIGRTMVNRVALCGEGRLGVWREKERGTSRWLIMCWKLFVLIGRNYLGFFPFIFVEKTGWRRLSVALHDAFHLAISRETLTSGKWGCDSLAVT